MRFDKPKGQRLHRFFLQIKPTCHSTWWCVELNKWVDYHKEEFKEYSLCSCKPCKTLREFKRHLRKHPEIRGKCTLVSRFEGYDIHG